MSIDGVTVIFNDDSDEKTSLAENPDIAAQAIAANDVCDGLLKSGFKSSVVALKTTDKNAIDGFIDLVKGSRNNVIFNLCEGVLGKSALELHVAALFEIYGVMFTGSGPVTLGLALNKGLTKDILSKRGIPTADYAVVSDASDISGVRLNYPLIVKPLCEDASLGIDSGAVVNTPDELRKRAEYVITSFSQPAIVEEFIDGREFNISVLGNGATAKALKPAEIEFVDFPAGSPRIVGYEAKWVPASPFYKKTVPVCPANVTEDQAAELTAIAVKAFKIMGCRDYARVDMRLGKDGRFRVLEVNPNPDISIDAGLARAARVAGFEYHDLVAHVVGSALERYGYAPGSDVAELVRASAGRSFHSL